MSLNFIWESTISDGATLDVAAQGLSQASCKLGMDLIRVGGAGVGGDGAIIASSSTLQYRALEDTDIELTDDIVANTVKGGRFDFRGENETTYVYMNGHNIRKIGPGEFYFRAANVVPGGAVSVDVEAGTLRTEGNATYAGGTENKLILHNGATFCLRALSQVFPWTICLKDGSKVLFDESGPNVVGGEIILESGSASIGMNAGSTVKGEAQGVISGSGQLTLNPSSAKVLSVSNPRNTYTGGTVVQSGIYAPRYRGSLPDAEKLTVRSGAAIRLLCQEDADENDWNLSSIADVAGKGTFSDQEALLDLNATGSVTVGGGGEAWWTIAGTAKTVMTNLFAMARRHNHVAVLNLNGGELEAKRIDINANNSTNVQSYVNFNGGLLRVTREGAFFSKAPTAATIYKGGATFDGSNFVTTVDVPLVCPTEYGITAITLPLEEMNQLNYIGSPVVTISGGNGHGATAFVHYDSTNEKLTRVEVTSAGRGYLADDVVSVSVTGGGYTNVFTGTATIGALDKTGGVTVRGSGDGSVTFTKANTFGGAMGVASGTLKLGVREAFPEGNDIVVSGGVFDAAGYTLTAGKVVLTGGVLTVGSLTCDELEVGSGATVNGAVASPEIGGLGTIVGSDVSYSGTVTFDADDFTQERFLTVKDGRLDLSGVTRFEFEHAGALSRENGYVILRAEGTGRIVPPASPFTVSGLPEEGGTWTIFVRGGKELVVAPVKGTILIFR